MYRKTLLNRYKNLADDKKQEFTYNKVTASDDLAAASKEIEQLLLAGESLDCIEVINEHYFGKTYCCYRNKIITVEEAYAKFKRNNRLKVFFKGFGILSLIGGVILAAGLSAYGLHSAYKSNVTMKSIEETKVKLEKTEEIKQIKDDNHELNYGEPSPGGLQNAKDMQTYIDQRTNSDSVIALLTDDTVYFITGNKKGISTDVSELNNIDDTFQLSSSMNYSVDNSWILNSDELYVGMPLSDSYGNRMGTIYVTHDKANEIYSKDGYMIDDDGEFLKIPKE